jgi:hypothetical protein
LLPSDETSKPLVMTSPFVLWKSRGSNSGVPSCQAFAWAEKVLQRHVSTIRAVPRIAQRRKETAEVVHRSMVG